MAAGCAGCGEPPVLGTGGVRSGMALLYDAGSAADEAVLANMLVRVVGVEPADVLRFQPRACHACADAVTAQLDAVRPRVVLALGPLARGLLFGEPGAWVRLGAWSAIGTWHPAELATDPARKRVAFEVLKGVAARR
jgi:uracil-DNA glycosylase